MKQMEVNITELRAQSTHVGTWMKEAGQRMAAQDEQLSQVALGLQQAQSDIVAVRTEVHTSASTLHQAMQSGFSNMKQDLVSDLSQNMDQQLSRFEMLLTAKKARQE